MQLRTVLRPADDLPDQWVAHCLDLDVVTQGRSRDHAMAMAVEAVSIVLAEARATGQRVPGHAAPAHAWATLDDPRADVVDIAPLVAR